MAKAKKATTRKSTKPAAAPKAAGRSKPARASPSAPPPDSATPDELTKFLDGFDSEANLKLPPSAPPPESTSTAEKRSRARTAGAMTAEQYERHKDRNQTAQSEQSRKGRDIAVVDDDGNIVGNGLPPIADPERRERCRLNLELALLTYFAEKYPLPFGDDHRKLIKCIEHDILHGGLDAYAFPRGSGKTTVSECAVMWAMLYAHRRFVPLIGASADASDESLLTIRTEFETNELLHDDFPEICYPIAMIDGITNRCRGQLFKGERTRITWKDKKLVLPTIPGSPASGSVIVSRGITGRIRGMKYTLADGTSIRPDYVMVDDPQTEESAASPKENAKRLKVLTKAIIGLAGPGKKIAGNMPCTVIEPGDMADQVLDRNKFPQWNGLRVPGLKSFPERLDLWEKFGELRNDCLRSGDKTASAAIAFLRENFDEMHRGGATYWDSRHEPDELSALQNLMTWWLTDPDGFAAEVQQQPVSLHGDDLDLLSVDEITLKQHAQPRDVVPMAADRITAFVDVGEKLLWYCVMAWSPQFSGYVLRYGTWPDQGVVKFQKRKPKKSLVDFYTKGKRKPSIDTATRHGLDDLATELLGLTFQSESGITLGIKRLLVDAGDRDTLIKRFIRERADQRIYASFGRSPKVGGAKIHEFKKRDRDLQVGDHWRSSVDPAAKIIYVTYDTNVWKSRAHQRLATDIEERGSVSLYKLDPWRHEMFAEHLRSEARRRVEVNGDEMDIWEQTPALDNDYFDTFVGCHVAASIEGCSLWAKTPGVATGQRPRKKRKGPIKSRSL